MARNKFDQDETLETPFSFSHLKRAGKYIKRHARRMITALTLSAHGGHHRPAGPQDHPVRAGQHHPGQERPPADSAVGGAAGRHSIISVAFTTHPLPADDPWWARTSSTTSARTCSSICRSFPSSYYDDRPHGKILTRVVHYVNNVSDILSNGIINFVLEIFNILFICHLHVCHQRPSCPCMVFAGMPVFLW